MKAIALVVVGGGVAYVYTPEHVCVPVVDMDNIDAGGNKTRLPRGMGFEALVKEAGVRKYVTFTPKGM